MEISGFFLGRNGGHVFLAAFLTTALAAPPVQVEVRLSGCSPSWQGAGTHLVSPETPALVFIYEETALAGIVSLSQSDPSTAQVDASFVVPSTAPGFKGTVSTLYTLLPAASSTHVHEFPEGCHLEILNNAQQNNLLVKQ